MAQLLNLLRIAFLAVCYWILGSPISVFFADWDNTLCASEKLFEVALVKLARYLGIDFKLSDLPESVAGSAAGHPEYGQLFSDKFFEKTGNRIPPTQIAQIMQFIWVDLAKKDPMTKTVKRFFRICRLFKIKIVVCSNNHTYICRLWAQELYPEFEDLFLHFYGKTRLRTFADGKAYYAAMIAYPPEKTGVALEDSPGGRKAMLEAGLRGFYCPIDGILLVI